MGLIFLILAAVLLYSAFQVGNFVALLLLAYGGIAFLLLSASYFLKSAKIFRKAKDGLLPFSSYLLLWPYFVLNGLSWKLFRCTTKEEPFHEIVPGLFLGCRLGANDRREFEKIGIRSVLDLTGEFRELNYVREAGTYRCIPVLDHCSPSLTQLEEGIGYIKEKLAVGPVYVHCALGHGRSATVVAGYLLTSGIVHSVEDAIAFLQKKRSGVNLKPGQIATLKNLMKHAQRQDEIFDVVNERDEVIGQRTRGEVHRLGLRHRAVHVLVFNGRGELFLQKRSLKKDTFPGTWDSSASGHLDSGEDYDVCAVRELREELGWNADRAPERLFKIVACEQTGQEFVWVYRLEVEGPFTLHPEEIETGGWYSPEQITRWMAERPQEFAHALLLIWKKFTKK